MTADRDPERFAKANTSIPCRYCGEPVEAEFDGEGGYWYYPMGGAHLFGCMSENPAGEWIVRTTQNHPDGNGRVTERRYTTQRRAREEAADLRLWNPRNRPCGQYLDIVVVRQPVPVA